jgi:hypothetical protein
VSQAQRISSWIRQAIGSGSVVNRVQVANRLTGAGMVGAAYGIKPGSL